MTNKGKMIEAIYAACLTKRATLVIFYLINRANQELTCFPSVGTIAKECNMSTRTVQRALNDLEGAGFLERESQFHKKGGQRSNLYNLKLSQNKNEMSEMNYAMINQNDNDISNNIISNKEISSKKYRIILFLIRVREFFLLISQIIRKQNQAYWVVVIGWVTCVHAFNYKD